MKRNILKSLVVPPFVIGCLLMLSIVVLTASNSQSASDWKPTSPVQIFVNSAAGSSPDIDSRMIQRLFQEKKLVDANIVITNYPGGSGGISFINLNKHAGDGHYFGTSSPSILTSRIIENVPVAHTDFTQLAILHVAYPIFVVRADSPIKTGKDYLDRLKKDPSSLSIGTTSRGNQNHVAAAIAVKSVGGDVNKMKVVSFPGQGDVMMSLLGGHIDSGVGPIGVYAPQLEAGKLRAVAVAAPQRLEGARSNIPTWKEQGHNVVIADFRNLMGPKGLSQAQVAYWDSVFSNLTKLDEWKKYVRSISAEPSYLNSKEAKVFIDEQFDTLKSILTELGMAAI
jgi:putative tricarboxylic transport membrane protein